MILGKDLKLLTLDEKKSKEFYKFIIDNNTTSEMQIGSLMAHLCWKNYEISRKFGKIILRGLNNVKLSLLRPYLAYMESYLTIKDEY